MTAARTSFRVVHVSIQATHVHAIVEADDRLALARGMQGFQIACARRFHRLRGSRGQNNWRRHREDETAAHTRFYPDSSAPSFPGWAGAASFRRGLERLPVVGAATWLLATGWHRHGLVSPFARPGLAPHRAPRDSEPRAELDHLPEM